MASDGSLAVVHGEVTRPAPSPELAARVLADYRETISDLLLDTFTTEWSSWATRHRALVRNQAHGKSDIRIDVGDARDHRALDHLVHARRRSHHLVSNQALHARSINIDRLLLHAQERSSIGIMLYEKLRLNSARRPARPLRDRPAATTRDRRQRCGSAGSDLL